MIEDKVKEILFNYGMQLNQSVTSVNEAIKEICQLFSKPDEGLREWIAKTMWLAGDKCSPKLDALWNELPIDEKRQWLRKAEPILTKVASYYQNYVELDRIQKYIDENNIFQVEFEHYDYSEKAYGKWIPLKTHRINIMEVLK